MESKMKCKVVMLATNEIQANGVQIIKNTGRLRFPITGAELRRIVNSNSNWKPQHLYLISDEDIKVGDYAYDSVDKVVHKVTFTEDNSYINQGWYKIIATTDTTLNLPLIPQSFIEKYVEVNGKIEEVMVEIGIIEFTDGWMPSYNNPDNNGLDEPAEPIFGVKTRKDNTVIISKVKDTWTKEEVEILCSRAALAAIVNFKKPNSFDIDDWLIKNLN